jgi:RimJ/RimL family protein N-acetyltransferase
MIASTSEVPTDASISGARGWISGAQRRFSGRVAVDFVVDRGGVVVGEVGLGPIDVARRAAYVGYWVFEVHRGHGVATAALNRLIAWVRELGEFDVLLAKTTPNNAASISVLEHNGFAELSAPNTWALELVDAAESP